MGNSQRNDGTALEDILLASATEKQARVREAVELHGATLTLQQLQTDLQGGGPSYGEILERRLAANAREHPVLDWWSGPCGWWRAARMRVRTLCRSYCRGR